jgi:hypothetical protein
MEAKLGGVVKFLQDFVGELVFVVEFKQVVGRQFALGVPFQRIQDHIAGFLMQCVMWAFPVLAGAVCRS